MPITKESLEEFRKLYLGACGRHLSGEDAREMATRLINLYLIIYHPLPGERGDKATPPTEVRPAPDAAFPKAE